MKKIAIVSCYFKHNYGSMLQAYATQKALDKLGYENETINISGFDSELKKEKIKYFIKAAITSDILISKIGMAKSVLYKKLVKNDYTSNVRSRDKKFDAFKDKYFRLSEPYCSKKDLSDKCGKNYSSVIVGSDQLWLPGNIAADYYTLNFVPQNQNTIAYATSFGQAQLPKDSSKKAAIFLKKIKHISVRELSGQALIKKLSGRNVPVVCDPTLLFTGEEWLDIQDTKPFIDGDYILCYFLGNNPSHREFAKKLRDLTGFKIAALLHLDEYIRSDDAYADITPYDVGPEEFINLIRNAKYVCTDSFHCSVFSILYKREFFTFRRYSRNTRQSTNSRLDSLLNSLNISERLMTGTEDIHKCMSLNTDFDAAHKKIEAIREYSLNYLVSSIEDKAGTDL